ncbi:hypothetical protein [Nocardia sp. NPDC051570]|uniref:hypothetical protein n=1 Tax=Nocardia sp. NPDC051570 TaxID=3364324 RepID=UPI0037B9D855
MSKTLRVAVIGLAGCGKSTCASLIEEFAAARGLRYGRVKLAQPLYELQSQVYRVARVPIADGAQDQILMEALATALRRIRPESLAEDFLDRLDRTDADIVVNDDLRDPYIDAVALRARSFRVIRVTADQDVRATRLAGRGDPTRTDGSTAQLDLIEPDVVIDNSAELDAYRRTVHDLLGSWL